MANPSTVSVPTASQATNREFVNLWTNTADAALQTAFDLQNAALITSQAWFESAASVNRDAFRRWTELARQTQSSFLSAYQRGARAVEFGDRPSA